MMMMVRRHGLLFSATMQVAMYCSMPFISILFRQSFVSVGLYLVTTLDAYMPPINIVKVTNCRMSIIQLCMYLTRSKSLKKMQQMQPLFKTQ